MNDQVPEREAKLLPVVTTIFGCAVCIVVGSYLLTRLF
jgi:hypothetical protein